MDRFGHYKTENFLRTECVKSTQSMSDSPVFKSQVCHLPYRTLVKFTEPLKASEFLICKVEITISARPSNVWGRIKYDALVQCLSHSKCQIYSIYEEEEDNGDSHPMFTNKKKEGDFDST